MMIVFTLWAAGVRGGRVLVPLRCRILSPTRSDPPPREIGTDSPVPEYGRGWGWLGGEGDREKVSFTRRYSLRERCGCECLCVYVSVHMHVRTHMDGWMDLSIYL